MVKRTEKKQFPLVEMSSDADNSKTLISRGKIGKGMLMTMHIDKIKGNTSLTMFTKYYQGTIRQVYDEEINTTTLHMTSDLTNIIPKWLIKKININGKNNTFIYNADNDVFTFNHHGITIESIVTHKGLSFNSNIENIKWLQEKNIICRRIRDVFKQTDMDELLNKTLMNKTQDNPYQSIQYNMDINKTLSIKLKQ